MFLNFVKLPVDFKQNWLALMLFFVMLVFNSCIIMWFIYSWSFTIKHWTKFVENQLTMRFPCPGISEVSKCVEVVVLLGNDLHLQLVIYTFTPWFAQPFCYNDHYKKARPSWLFASFAFYIWSNCLKLLLLLNTAIIFQSLKSADFLYILFSLTICYSFSYQIFCFCCLFWFFS